MKSIYLIIRDWKYDNFEPSNLCNVLAFHDYERAQDYLSEIQKSYEDVLSKINGLSHGSEREKIIEGFTAKYQPNLSFSDELSWYIEAIELKDGQQ